MYFNLCAQNQFQWYITQQFALLDRKTRGEFFQVLLFIINNLVNSIARWTFFASSKQGTLATVIKIIEVIYCIVQKFYNVNIKVRLL